MQTERTTLLATAIVIGTGALWGLYWVPVRNLATIGLPGAWGTLAIVLVAAIVLCPFAIAGRRQLAQASPLGLAAIALGGAAFTLYSVSFVYGRVAIVTLLFFLSPVWSTLIARYLLGWHTPRLRLAAIVVGLIGLATMLGAEGELPLPRGIGEWLGLISGLLWSIATTCMRIQATPGPAQAAFVFATGACVAALVLAPLLEPWPTVPPASLWGPALGWAVAAGGLWWGLSMAGLMWATPRLEPARVGILLMGEVLIGAMSAALLAGEHLGGLEIVGGAFVLCAGVLEVWPIRQPGPAGSA